MRDPSSEDRVSVRFQFSTALDPERRGAQWCTATAHPSSDGIDELVFDTGDRALADAYEQAGRPARAADASS